MPLEYEIKFVLAGPDLESELTSMAIKDQTYSIVHIEQYYLSKPARLRKSSTLIKNCRLYYPGEETKHFFAYKPKINGSVIEIETEINNEDFVHLLTESKKSLIKIRLKEEIYCKNEHWIVDFFKFNGGTYFIQAECELYGEAKRPSRMPDFIRRNVKYQVDHAEREFSSRSLCDVNKARRLYERVIGGKHNGPKKIHAKIPS